MVHRERDRISPSFFTASVSDLLFRGAISVQQLFFLPCLPDRWSEEGISFVTYKKRDDDLRPTRGGRSGFLPPFFWKDKPSYYDEPQAGILYQNVAHLSAKVP